MNSSNRLLFAAARGARIEYNAFTAARPNWITTSRWLTIHHRCLRIHPRDKHLAYGPISTVLRHDAEHGLKDVYHVWEMPLGLSVWLCASDHINLNCADDLITSLFLLILAEALADEGL